MTLSELIGYLNTCGKSLNVRKIGPESALTISMAGYLKGKSIEGKLKGIWFHVANEGTYGKNSNPIYGMLLKCMGKLNGVADFVFLHKDGAACVEIKSGKGKLSPSNYV